MRIVKSAKTRTFESLESGIKSIRNAMKIRDFSTIQTNYDDLMKNISSSKTMAIINAHGGIPRFFVRILCDLEDYIAERKKDKAAFKKLSPTQGRALNRLGLTLKKNNKTYEKLMDEYRANPSASDVEDNADEVEKAMVSGSESDDESSSSSSSASSSSSSSSESDSDASSKSVSVMTFLVHI